MWKLLFVDHFPRETSQTMVSPHLCERLYQMPQQIWALRNSNNGIVQAQQLCSEPLLRT